MFHKIVKATGLKKFFFKENIKEYIAVATPDISTTNLGDKIIADAVFKQLRSVLPEKFFIQFPTQIQYSSKCLNFYNMAAQRIIGGSNLMTGHIKPCYNQWDVSIWQFWKYRPAILMGVGWKCYQEPPSIFAKLFYSSLLSRNGMHSVRDAYTEAQMRKLGYNNVINTACPTTWDLTREHCDSIPVEKSPTAVFTITDYARDPEMIQEMLKVIRMNYKKVFFFQQGIKDLQYLRDTVSDISNINILPASLEEYNNFLKSERPDFIGTRLHGGIRALQYGCRTLIIGIDNRAVELSRDINIPVLGIEKLNELGHILKDSWKTEIRIPSENIQRWKAQFHN